MISNFSRTSSVFPSSKSKHSFSPEDFSDDSLGLLSPASFRPVLCLFSSKQSSFTMEPLLPTEFATEGTEFAAGLGRGLVLSILFYNAFLRVELVGLSSAHIRPSYNVATKAFIISAG